MKKRLLAAALVIALVLTTLLACSSKEKDTETAAPKKETKEAAPTKDTKKDEVLPESTKVILNEVAHSIFYAPMYVAIEEGYFEDLVNTKKHNYKIWIFAHLFPLKNNYGSATILIMEVMKYEGIWRTIKDSTLSEWHDTTDIG